MTRLCAALSIVALLITAEFASAQNATGSLLGEVQDASGARIRSAAVTVTSNTSGVSRQTTTGSGGEFRFWTLFREAITSW